MTIALFLATLVGLSLGLFGGGGSILSVAILSFALDMPPKAAIAVSLLVIGATSTAALIAQRGNGLVSIRTGVVFGAAGMVGAFAGGRLASLIPEAVLLTAFGVVMLLASLAMLRGKTASSEVGSWRAREESPLRVLGVLMLASTVGIVTGVRQRHRQRALETSSARALAARSCRRVVSGRHRRRRARTAACRVGPIAPVHESDASRWAGPCRSFAAASLIEQDQLLNGGLLGPLMSVEHIENVRSAALATRRASRQRRTSIGATIPEDRKDLAL